jgi:dTDP-D-glucose 4,6-dehydratase
LGETAAKIFDEIVIRQDRNLRGKTDSEIIELMVKGIKNIDPNKKVTIKHIDGPTGVRGRNSNNDLIKEKLSWNYEMSLEEGITKLYVWVEEQVNESN